MAINLSALLKSISTEEKKSIRSHRNVDNINIINENISEHFKNKRSSILIMKSIDLQVFKIIKRTDGCWCAGGAPLAMYTGDTNQIRDWDLYFNNHEILSKTKTLLMGLDFKLFNDTKYALTLEKSGVLVQLVHGKMFKSIEHIFSTFDFSASCIGVDGKDFLYEEQTLKSIENKTLEFYGTINLQYTLYRLAKYGAKNFRPSNNFGLALYDFIEKNGKDVFQNEDCKS